MAEMTLKERIESRISTQRHKFGKRVYLEASVFLDGMLFEACGNTKEICVQKLIDKYNKKDGIKA